MSQRNDRINSERYVREIKQVGLGKNLYYFIAPSIQKKNENEQT
jgi:hypothetical protein